MEYLNILLPNNQSLTVGYKYADSIYEFEQNIVIDKWVINKIIKVGGPKRSHYKYNCDNYFELAITDQNDLLRIEKYFYNCKDLELLRARQKPIDDISDFIQSSPIFQCKDWADYDAYKILMTIEKIINKNISKQEQLEQIKRVLNIA